MNVAILETKELCRTVTEDGHEKTIIDNFNFTFNHKTLYTIIGPSGAGKSSLLRLLNRLDEPTSGKIIFDDKPQYDYAPCELRRRIGYLFQSPYLFPETVKDNFLYADQSIDERTISKLLDEVRLPQKMLNSHVDKLSIGEKQRVALARLLVTKPDIVLLDEPTSALDPSVTDAIEELISEIVEVEELTAIMVTHNPEQALRIGEEAILLVDGKLVESGATKDVLNNPKSELGKRYKGRTLR